VYQQFENTTSAIGMASSEVFSNCWIHRLKSPLPQLRRNRKVQAALNFDHVWFAYRNIPIDTGDGKNRKEPHGLE